MLLDELDGLAAKTSAQTGRIFDTDRQGSPPISKINAIMANMPYCRSTPDDLRVIVVPERTYPACRILH